MIVNYLTVLLLGVAIGVFAQAFADARRASRGRRP